MMNKGVLKDLGEEASDPFTWQFPMHKKSLCIKLGNVYHRGGNNVSWLKVWGWLLWARTWGMCEFLEIPTTWEFVDSEGHVNSGRLKDHVTVLESK